MITNESVIIRKQKGYRQAEIAELLQVSVRTVSRWENDQLPPKFYLLVLQKLEQKPDKHAKLSITN